MSGSSGTPRDVAKAFTASFATSLSCITSEQLTAPRASYIANGIYPLIFEKADDVQLPTTRRDGRYFRFAFRHTYQIMVDDHSDGKRAFRASTRKYAYRILDQEGAELLCFHWDPTPESGGITYQHVHVSARATIVGAGGPEEFEFDKLHIPTQRISIEAVVRMLITEFEVEPLRSDWNRVLRAEEAAFHARWTQHP